MDKIEQLLLFLTSNVFFGIGIGVFLSIIIHYSLFIRPQLRQSLDEIINKHRLINQSCEDISTKIGADRILVFQVIDGEYFIGGNRLMRLMCTNDITNPQKPHLKKVRHKIKPIYYHNWYDVLSILKKEGLLTLSESNQYEGFNTSLQAVKARGMKGGFYFKISKKIFNRTQMSAILCVEYEQPPPFTAEFCLTQITDEYNILTDLISKQIELKMAREKIKDNLRLS